VRLATGDSLPLDEMHPFVLHDKPIDKLRENFHTRRAAGADNIVSPVSRAVAARRAATVGGVSVSPVSGGSTLHCRQADKPQNLPPTICNPFLLLRLKGQFGVLQTTEGLIESLQVVWPAIMIQPAYAFWRLVRRRQLRSFNRSPQTQRTISTDSRTHLIIRSPLAACP
jgi:hypothetical protein